MVATGTDQQDAPNLLHRIDQAFAGASIYAGGLRLQVTSSLGLVCEPGRPERRLAPAQRVEELLSSADREMYAHKRSRAGMNRLLTLAQDRKKAG